MWRSWTSHLCSLIQALHNRCLDQDGHYLTEISSIDNYHERLCRIFYLNDNALQEHFKLFMMAYLSYNSQIAILDEPEIALGLIQAGKTRTDGQLPEYLWLVSQVRIDPRGVSKLVKVADDILEEANADNLELVNQTLIPVVSALSNYLCYEQDGFVIDQLIDNDYFQRVFMHSLTQNGNIDLAQEALLLCSNLLGKSADLASKMMCS